MNGGTREYKLREGIHVVFRARQKIFAKYFKSFQRNGKTLDGNGTVPDIVIERDENQVLRKRDSQLEKLIELIKN